MVNYYDMIKITSAVNDFTIIFTFGNQNSALSFLFTYKKFWFSFLLFAEIFEEEKNTWGRKKKMKNWVSTRIDHDLKKS